MPHRVSATAFLVLLATAAPALEKAVAPAPREAPGFARSSTVSVSYYNVCTGWTWSWTGFPPQATYGVRFDDISAEDDVLLRTHMFYSHGAPAGYGFTNVVFAFPPFDPSCPGAGPIDLAFFTPVDGWNTIEWNAGNGIPVGDFWVLVTHPTTPGNPVAVLTEKGETGGPRPGGCGLCFLPSRPIHSRQFGQEDVIVCPGAPWFDDSPCNLELIWVSEVRLGPSVSIEDTSWGRVKSLYH